ncbi:hypothetical protein EJ110_NYTH32859 [Nymphaea thermarum]|nr:hypothetical protein EJ110_NYTH32859 [Nymphaea thermarum]
MARVLLLSLLLFAIFFILEAQNEPEASPAPAPDSGADGPPRPHFFPQVSPPSMSAPASAPSPRSSVNLNSPPAPPPPEDSPSPPSLGPSMNEEQNAVNSGGKVPDPTSSRGGGKAGRVAGTVVGVVIGAAVVTVAFIIYRKRRQNIRRSQYGFAARREML